MSENGNMKLAPIPIEFWARLEQAVDANDATVDSIRRIFASIRRYGVKKPQQTFSFQKIADAYGIGATRLVAFIEAWGIMRPLNLKSNRGRVRNRVWALNASLVGMGLTNETEYDPRKPADFVSDKFVYYEAWDERKENGTVRVFNRWTRKGVEFVMDELHKHGYKRTGEIEGYDTGDFKPSGEILPETGTDTPEPQENDSKAVSDAAETLTPAVESGVQESNEIPDNGTMTEEIQVAESSGDDTHIMEVSAKEVDAVHETNEVTLDDMLFEFLSTRKRISLSAICSYLTNCKNDMTFDTKKILRGELSDRYAAAFSIQGTIASTTHDFDCLHAEWEKNMPESLKRKIENFRIAVDAEVL